MYSIEVYAAFDFLPEEVMVGTLEYERIKGNASYRFSYSEDFLKRFPGISLSADLGHFPGIQAAANRIFSCFGDTLPDRWGRALIDKRERILAAGQGRIPRTFDDFGYLVRIDDRTRMGAFRYKYRNDYLGGETEGMRVPPVESLDSFIRDAQMLEKAEQRGTVLVDRWVDNVWRQGSSLGGARPKSNVVDADGSLWIAKIPSVRDTYDIALWEHFACLLARKAGIEVAQTRLLRIGPTPYHTLLSKRFDREETRRIHFASSLTLTGLKDGDSASEGKGYLDIANVMVGAAGIAHPRKNLEELYRRVAYYIAIGNQDDHFRNHGFLLGKSGWELSPAYDINPTNALTQSLLISENSNRSSLRELLLASDYYLIERSLARQVIQEVCDAVRPWRQVAKNTGIPVSEQERFAKRFEQALAEGDALSH